MAKVSIQHDIPQIATPVGSYEEVRKLGVPTRNIATCSERDSTKNFGCPEWENCDRAHRGVRPHNEIVRTIGMNGDVRTGCQACFVTVCAEKNADDKNVLVQVVGGEGDKYTYRGSVKAHVTRDPNCNDCAQGKCDKWVDRSDLEGVCPTFPAAATHPELVRFARRVEARMTGSQMRKAAMEKSLLGGDDELEAAEAPEPPVRGGRARG